MQSKIEKDLVLLNRRTELALQHGNVMDVEIPPSLVPGNKRFGELTKGDLEHINSVSEGAERYAAAMLRLLRKALSQKH